MDICLKYGILEYAQLFYIAFVTWIIYTTTNPTTFNKQHSFLSIHNNVFTRYWKWCFTILFLTVKKCFLSMIWMIHYKVSSMSTINTLMQKNLVPHKILKVASKTSMVSMNNETSQCAICKKIVNCKR